MTYEGRAVRISAQRLTISKARDYFVFNQVLSIPEFRSSSGDSGSAQGPGTGLDENLNPVECDNNLTSVVLGEECKVCEDLIEGCEECELNLEDALICTKYFEDFLSCNLTS